MSPFASLPGFPVESDRVDKVWWKKPKSSGVLHPTLLSDLVTPDRHLLKRPSVSLPLVRIAHSHTSACDVYGLDFSA